MNKLIGLAVLLALCPIFTCLVMAASDDSKPEPFEPDESLKWDLCRAATGLKSADLRNVIYRNNKCSIDCVTASGLIIPTIAAENKQCYKPGHKCLLGKCLSESESDESKKLINYSDYVRPKVRVLSAKVRDMDQLPTTGESDVYVVIKYLDHEHPALQQDQILCHTWIIQDNDRPVWNDHSCTLMPMSRQARIEFAAYDSDKPRSIESDFLGYNTISVDRLLKNKTIKLQLKDEKHQSLLDNYIEISASLVE